MNHCLKKLAAAALLSLAAGQTAQAVVVVVEPDTFAAGTNITNSFAGVTLSSVGGGFGGAGGIFVVTPSTQTEPFTASTGTRSFGHGGTSFPHLFREPGFQELRADFDSPTDLVQIDFISNDSDDTGILRAFSAADVLLGTYTTASLSANQFETMTLNIPNIAYILAGGNSGQSSGGLDNLRFNATLVPEPGTAALGLLGAMGLLIRRRRTA